MQPTPKAYTPYADTRKISVQTIYELIDVTAADDATVTATSEASISRLNQTADKIQLMTKRIATCEPNQWRLDGRFQPPDTENFEIGWWSNAMSGSNKAFAAPQVLTFAFSQNENSNGFTVIFDDKTGDCASDFTISTYNSDNVLLTSATVTGNSDAIKYVPLPTTGYRKVVATFTKTSLPYRRLRVAEFVFGQIQTFDGDDISGIETTFEISPTMESLPSKALTLTINNIDKRYNVLNPVGIYRFLQKGQGILVQLGINDEYVNLGRFYFRESKANDDALTVSIYANDMFITLDKTTCTIGQSGTWTVLQAVTAVIADSGQSIVFDIPTSIGARTVQKCIPSNTTHREAIRLIAQAGRCICFFDRYNTLMFREFDLSSYVDELNDDRIAKRPTITDTGSINTVVVTARDEYNDEAEDVVYTSTDKESDETENALEITNDLVASQDTADWLLQMAKFRIEYDITEQGNPARELCDSVKVYDIYGENKNTLTVKETFRFDGGLSGTIRTMAVM